MIPRSVRLFSEILRRTQSALPHLKIQQQHAQSDQSLGASETLLLALLSSPFDSILTFPLRYIS
jgi:hypothetical protein